MGPTGHVIDEEWFLWRGRVHAAQIFDGVIGHRRREVPAFVAYVGINGRGVEEEVARLPLVGVSTDEAIEILKAHAGGPAIERTRLARLKGRCVVSLAKPGRRVAVLPEDFPNRPVGPLDDGVVSGKAGGHFGDDSIARGVVIAARDERCTGG